MTAYAVREPTGISGLGRWRYRTTTDAFPASGRLQFDNVTIDSATELYIHDTNNDGTDMTAFLDLLQEGDLIYIQISADASQFVVLEVGVFTKAGSVYTFPLIEAEGQGTTPANNTLVSVVTTIGGNVPAIQKTYENLSNSGFVFSDFLEPPGGLQADGIQSIAAGAFAGSTTPGPGYDSTNHPGVWGMHTGTTAAGRVFLLSGFPLTMHVGVGGITRLGCWFQVGAALSVAANRYVLRVGWSSMLLPNTIIQGITFEYQDDQNGGRWQCVTEDGVAETSVDTGILAVAGAWTFHEIVVNAAGTSVEFFMDKVSVGIITTNIPSGVGRLHFINFHIMKLTGVLDRAPYIDAFYMHQEITR
jgi:hypothetical protein